jgi:polysaccharide biosynthesis protein PslF
VPNSYGFLSTYPPTACSLATFSHSLMRNLVANGSGDTAGVVRVTDTPISSNTPEVVGHLYTRSAKSHDAAAAALNNFDVAIVQQEYGIYGGQDGDQLLAVLEQVRVPVVVVAHTVAANPTPHQTSVLRKVVEASDAVVTMTEAARERLIRRYEAEPSKIRVIGHGASPETSMETGGPGRRPVILTWGLLGPGKGIEWAIDGLQKIRHLRPSPVYIVAGQTHPRVHLQEGESYRLKLAQRARFGGVSHLVRFMGSYLTNAVLTQLIRRADVVLLPYDSRDQLTSGVLVEAVAAGKPVVATAFPHAVELLGGGAGLLVPQFDGPAIGAALHRVLTEPGLAGQMQAEAARLSPASLWPAVADQYRTLATTLLANRVSVP